MLNGGPAEFDSDGLRLHVFLARAGKGSRRAMEKAVAQGRVAVNGLAVTVMGVRVDPARDAVTLDGHRVDPHVVGFAYIALHKPVGVVTTVRDDLGRPTVLDLIPDYMRRRRLYPVGRLDVESEGLVLLTNDGHLTNALTHPRFGHEREYVVTVEGRPPDGALRKLSEGVELDGVRTAPARFEALSAEGATSTLRVVLREGRNRQIRRMLADAGHPVVGLKRVRLGPLRLGDLKPGGSRRLADHEIRSLREGLDPVEQRRP